MDSNQASLLIVDDETELADLYASVLSDSYDVVTAYSGQEALEKVDDDIDVVLLDRRMPGMNGDEVLTEIRDRDLDVRVGMITAVIPEPSIAEMEFDNYLLKPLDSDEINEAVEQLVALSNHDEQIRELFSLAKKRAVVEETRPKAQLKREDEYNDLVTRFNELDAELSKRIAERDEPFFKKLSASVKEQQE